MAKPSSACGHVDIVTRTCERFVSSPSVCAEQKAEVAGRGAQVSITPITDRAGCVANFVAVQQARARPGALLRLCTHAVRHALLHAGWAGRACQDRPDRGHSAAVHSRLTRSLVASAASHLPHCQLEAAPSGMSQWPSWKHLSALHCGHARSVVMSQWVAEARPQVCASLQDVTERKASEAAFQLRDHALSNLSEARRPALGLRPACDRSAPWEPPVVKQVPAPGPPTYVHTSDETVCRTSAHRRELRRARPPRARAASAPTARARRAPRSLPPTQPLTRLSAAQMHVSASFGALVRRARAQLRPSRAGHHDRRPQHARHADRVRQRGLLPHHRLRARGGHRPQLPLPAGPRHRPRRRRAPARRAGAGAPRPLRPAARRRGRCGCCWGRRGGPRRAAARSWARAAGCTVSWPRSASCAVRSSCCAARRRSSRASWCASLQSAASSA